MHPNESVVRDRWSSLQREHAGLDGWTLIINGRMRSAMGRCRYTPCEVHLARWHIEQSDPAEVLDTLLHEAAHALAPERGHGREWKAWARRLGATPRARGHCRNSEQIDPKWHVECLNCGIAFDRRLRRRGWRHLYHPCSGGGRGRLRWIDRRSGGHRYIGRDPNRGRRRRRGLPASS